MPNDTEDLKYAELKKERYLENFYSLSKDDNQIYKVEDPTYLGFRLLFDFNNQSDPDRPYEPQSPLFNITNRNKDSAYFYLKSIGESDEDINRTGYRPGRAEMLKDFVVRLTDLVQNYPHYFQSISGLGETNLFPKNSGFNAKDRIISVDTLESIDMKVVTMMQRYVDAVFDFKNMRQMIPDNLLEFSCTVLASEIRDMRAIINKDSDKKGLEQLESINVFLPILVYQLKRCMFNFDEDFLSYGGTYSNTQPEQAASGFKMSVGILDTPHRLNFIELFVDKPIMSRSDVDQKNPLTGGIKGETTDNLPEQRTKKGSLLKNLQETTTNRVKSILSNASAMLEEEANVIKDKLNVERIGGRLINEFFDALENPFKQIFLGNVFDLYRSLRNRDTYDLLKEGITKIINIQNGTNQPSGQIIDQPAILDTTAFVDLTSGILGDLSGIIVPPTVSLGDLGNATPTPNASTLGDIDNTLPSINARALGDIDNTLPSPNGKDMGDIDDTLPSPNGKDMGDIDDTGQSPNGDKLGDIDDTGQSPNGDKLGDIDDTGQSASANALGDIDDTQQSPNGDKLGDIDDTGQSENADKLDNLDNVQQSPNADKLDNIKDVSLSDNGDKLGDIDDTGQSENADKLDNLDNVSPSENADKLGDIDNTQQSGNGDKLGDVKQGEIDTQKIKLSDVDIPKFALPKIKLDNEDVVKQSENAENLPDVLLSILNENIPLGSLNTVDNVKNIVESIPLTQDGKIDMVKLDIDKLTSSVLGFIEAERIKMTDPQKLFLGNVSGFENNPINSVVDYIQGNTLGTVTYKENKNGGLH